jgi:hypothetical protein
MVIDGRHGALRALNMTAHSPSIFTHSLIAHLPSGSLLGSFESQTVSQGSSGRFLSVKDAAVPVIAGLPDLHHSLSPAGQCPGFIIRESHHRPRRFERHALVHLHFPLFIPIPDIVDDTFITYSVVT